MLYLGIDNGASGAIAAVDHAGNFYRVDKMPTTDAELLALLQALVAVPPAAQLYAKAHGAAVTVDVFAMLEHAQAFPKMGRSGAFNYGRGYGAVQMALHAAGIPFDIAAPSKWQAVMQCSTKGDKNVSKRRAEQLFPSVKVTHAIADALLIAEYCRRLKRGIDGK